MPTMSDLFGNALGTRHIHILSSVTPFVFTDRISTDLSFDGLYSPDG